MAVTRASWVDRGRKFNLSLFSISRMRTWRWGGRQKKPLPSPTVKATKPAGKWRGIAFSVNTTIPVYTNDQNDIYWGQ